MFAHGGEYPVVCRYSSEPGDPGLDVRPFQSAVADGSELTTA